MLFIESKRLRLFHFKINKRGLFIFMEELKNKVIITNVPYICLIDESTFNKEGYNYEVLTYFYDEDYELPSYIGITKNKNLTFDEFKADCIKKEVEKLKKLKEKITKDEYFIHNDEIFPTYFILEENLKKYKRRKLGNPDVLKFVQYQKEHPEVTSYENHYDIKYFAQLVDIYPKDVIDNLAPGQSLVLVILNSVAFYSPEKVKEIAENDKLYNDTPLLFMVFSYVKNKAFIELSKSLTVTNLGQKGNWTLVKFTKFNNKT